MEILDHESGFELVQHQSQSLVDLHLALLEGIVLHLEVVHATRGGLRLVEMDAICPPSLLSEVGVTERSRQFVRDRRASVSSGAALSNAPSLVLQEVPQG